MNIQAAFERIDELFKENKPGEAHRYMLSCLEEASREGDAESALSILNELLGYYRQISDRDGVLQTARDALSLAESMGLLGTVPYATTALNVANALRAIGELEDSLGYYRITEDIFKKTLDDTDMRYAGLHNNLSLLYQELGDYQNAKKRLELALKISEANNEGFEIAVTHANLANTCVMAGDYEGAKTHSLKAIELLEKRGCIDAHYCAALSALGMCMYSDEEYEQAEKLFERAMEIMEECLGRNLQYERLRENRDACHEAVKRQRMNKSEACDRYMSGMELSRAFYEEFGRPMLHELFGEYENKIAVGLCGEGSECFGFDDELSRDHDFGPSFCMWLSDEAYDACADRLEAEYEKLPKEYAGVKTSDTGRLQKRRGVFRLSSFADYYIGTADASKIDWKAVPEYSFAAFVNGEIFTDPQGKFSELRAYVKKGYPREILLLKIAEDCARFSQNGQYNYFRSLSRKDYIAADMELMECIKASVSLLHHIDNVFLPHEKWIFRSVKSIAYGGELLEYIVKLHGCMACGREKADEVRRLTDELGSFFASLLYKAGYISDMEPYLDNHTEELVIKSDLYAKDHEQLVDDVVREEFDAFDKVNNEGGRASCQNNWTTFYIMRKSQYLTWDKDMLIQYLYDFDRELKRGHNLITEKYGRMMESTAPERYEQIKDNFPVISDEKRAIIEAVVAVYMQMADECAAKYPKTFKNARHLHTYEDNPFDTSYETYLRGEISTYSDKMLQLYAGFVINCAKEGRNIAYMTMENTAKLYGFKNLDEFETKC